MKYNFDKPVDRLGTDCIKYDIVEKYFGSNDLIPMWVADMDFKTPPFIIDAIKNRLDHEILGYTIRRQEFFESIVKWTAKRYKWKINKNWVIFTPGIVPAVNLCTLAFSMPGDSIIVQPPVYFPFFGAVKDHSRKLIFNKLKEIDGEYSFDFDDLKKKAIKGPKMLILCNPHNPVGRAWQQDELKQLADICLKNKILIVSDEIHSDLVLPGFKHTPTASLSKEISNITVTCFAPSKTFNLAGLSTSSMVISNKKLRGIFEKQINALHINGGNIFGTEASIAAYKQGEEWLDQLLIYINNNVEYVMKRLSNDDIPITPIAPQATYMIWLDCRQMKKTDKELSEFFVVKAGLALNPGAMFGSGGKGFMRMNLACPIATIKKALDQVDVAFSKPS